MKEYSPKEFKELFIRGHGRALIILNNSKNIERYRSIVLWACLHNTAYSQLSEGVRRDYIFEAIKKFDNIHLFEDAILEKFKWNLKEESLFYLLAELLFAFAYDGSLRAKDALSRTYKTILEFLLNKKIYKNNKHCYQVNYLERLAILLIQLGDFLDFELILNDLSVLIKHHSQFEDDFGWLFFIAAEKFGYKKTLKAIRQKKINYEPYESKKETNPVEDKPNIDELIEKCKEKYSHKKWRFFRYLKLGKYTAEEINLLAETLINENDIIVKANILWAFKFTPFPCNKEILIEYSKNENIELRNSAFEVLNKTQDEIVRTYALELLAEGKNIENAICMLTKNYQNNDSQVLIHSIKSIKVDYDTGWHDVFNDVLDLIRENKAAPKELLYYLYDKTLCSSCREFIVKTLGKKKMINSQLLQELKLDCNFDIKEYAYKLQKKTLSKLTKY